ncbi:MAG TPA: AI-2E family transporter [Anaeromyxobacter sp.]|nr:AI-2E family transporter [Anaeromyxobacter sp.]
MASEVHAQRLLVFLLIAAIALAAWLILPFWVPLTLAAVFAAALQTPFDRLTGLLRGRRKLAALVITLGVLLAVVLPLGGLSAAIVTEVLEGIEWFRKALASEGFAGLVRRLPDPIEELARRLVAAIPDPQRSLRQLAGAGGGEAAQAVGGFLVATGAAIFRAVLFLIALFFFLTDGSRLVDWIDAHVPLRPGQLRKLLDEFRRTSVSVLLASLATAAIQTGAGVVGYVIARAPNLFFLTLATFIVALVPAVGGSFVVVTVGLLLLATGHPIAGVFLIAWGIVIVSLVDNVARPYLLRGGMALHGGLLFFALLGGLAAFGGIGLVLGPLVLTFLVTVAHMYRREFGPPEELSPVSPAAAAALPPAAPEPRPEKQAGTP